MTAGGGLAFALLLVDFLRAVTSGLPPGLPLLPFWNWPPFVIDLLLSCSEAALSMTMSELPALLVKVPDYHIRHVIESRKSRRSDLSKVMADAITHSGAGGMAL